MKKMLPPAARRQPIRFDEFLTLLRQSGLLTAEQAQEASLRQERQRASLVHQRRGPEKLSPPMERQLAASITPIELFLSFGLTQPDGKPYREDFLTELFARHGGFPYEKIDPLKLNHEFVTSVFSKPFARKHTLLPLREEDGALVVATADPFNADALDTLGQTSGRPIRLVVASKSDLDRLITEFYGFRRSVVSAERDLSATYDISNLEQLVRMKSDREIEASDQHIVNAVEYLFNYAFAQRASDIHIEPKRDHSLVRFRIDGSLHDVNRLPKIVHNAVINRIKTLARLDIGEKRRPQDGRVKTADGEKEIEIRVSTLPVAFGEKIVLRIFDPAIVHDDLGKLGFFPRDLEVFSRLISLPHGIVLVTGPTGSGKTTTLYTALRKLATEDVNITTIEDPIEMVFDKINQTATQPAIGLGFAESLRTLLRQDPDIIMVGEIRDLETAQHAIQAALTGHLVFSTLHTNDAPGAITRLLDLGVQNFLLASTLSGLIAQRLMKLVCQDCLAERELAAEEVGALGIRFPEGHGPIKAKYGEGCIECRHTGYRGRTAIYEMFEINDAIKKLVMGRADTTEIRRQARKDGMITLREAAVRKMLMGLTSFEEVLSITRES